MLISDLARCTGVSARSLRHYETAGLLAPRRRSNGYREYGPEAVARVRQIRALLAAGLRLADLPPLLSCVVDDSPTMLRCPATIAAVQHGISSLDARITELRRTRDRLARVLAAPVPPPAGA